MRVITFSKNFPVKHEKAGQPTNFVGSILDGTKKHTIRAGNRWKEGDVFSGRVWSDRPYASKQIEFVEIKIEKIWTFKHAPDYERYWINEVEIKDHQTLVRLANNDGLSFEDFVEWFSIHPKTKDYLFTGQILCWDKSVQY